MKGLFLTYGSVHAESPTGVQKKVKQQMQAFNNEGLNCEAFALRMGKVNATIYKALSLLPFANIRPNWKCEKIFSDVDFIYLRKPNAISTPMRRLLKKIKTNNPNIRIVMEIPTYPYDKEYTRNITWYPLLLKDKYNRTRLKGLVDRFAVVGSFPGGFKLWNIPVIGFINGVDVKSIPTKKVAAKNDDSINMICVAQFAFWHGYERLIEGLANYYEQGGKRNVIVHFVGDGPELLKYKKISMERNLENHIVFHGRLTGMDLDAVYDISDIAVTSLGLYKNDKNIVGSFLKSREYLAKGLPMVTGCKIDVFLQHEFPYYIEFPNDSTPLDVEQIVAFYDSIYHGAESAETVISNIREYALNTVDIRKTMQPIIDYLRSETS